jgi:hypothetical protein
MSQVSRRQLLKILAAAAGTAMLSTVPNEWKTPVIDIGMIPAHAQGLSGTGTVAGFVYERVPAAPLQLSVSSPSVGSCPTPPSGSPFEGAQIQVNGYPSLFGLTNLNGAYSIGNVPAGPQYLILKISNTSSSPQGPYTVPIGGTICVSFLIGSTSA